MTITFPQVEGIFNTLPIGYYAGRKIPCALSKDCPSSYYDPFNDQIVISFIMIADAVSRMDEEIDDIESIIRGLLYHEVSHVFLTPANLKDGRNKKYSNGLSSFDVINIVEDERIETLCGSLYMNTNFRRNIILLNNWHGEKATDSSSAFYHLVRFHQGTEKWIERLNVFIRRYRNINATSEYNNVNYYRKAIINFYENFIKEFEKNPEEFTNPEENGSESNDSESNDSESSSSSSSSSSMSNLSDEKDDSEDEKDSKSGNDDMNNGEDESDETTDTSVNKSSSNNEDEDSDETKNDVVDKDEENKANNLDELLDKIIEFNEFNISNEIFKEIANKIITHYVDDSLTAKLDMIIANKLKKQSQNGSAIASYSGRFNPRSVVREDYRWWAQRNREGHIKHFSKVHFNLFIDNSGSFWRNDEKMNIFIRTLARIKDPNFSFDIITINTKIVEWEGNSKIFVSDGGNCLSPKIAEVIRRHTPPATNVYNIVLFDGDAHSDDGYGRGYGDVEPFKFFDNANTILITDDSNETYIKKANMSKANIKYVDNYCDEFISSICSLLEKTL